jgi:hypothetical protein
VLDGLVFRPLVLAPDGNQPTLRLREAGMIKSAPNKIIADGTNWRFYNELKRELKS